MCAIQASRADKLARRRHPDVARARNGLRREAVDRYVIAEPWSGTTVDRVDHDRAHAATAYLSSPFASATVVVCDDDAALSVWAGADGSLRQRRVALVGARVEDTALLWSVRKCAASRVLAPDQRFEALARLAPDARDNRLCEPLDDGRPSASDTTWLASLRRAVAGRGRDGLPLATRLAGALQNRVAELATDIIAAVSRDCRR